MRKKILSLAMSLIMVVTFMPTMALTSFAEVAEEPIVKATEPVMEENTITEETVDNQNALSETTESITGEVSYSLDSAFTTNGATNLAITADVHGATDTLSSWQSAVKNNGINVDKMIFCGDYSSRRDNLTEYLNDYNKVIKLTNKNFGANSGIYTSGEGESLMEYYGYTMPGTEVETRFTINKNFKRIGWAVNPTENKYGVYCLGASGNSDYYGYGTMPGSYSAEDIEQVDKALNAVVDKTKPVFIAAHYPLHATDMGETGNALELIKVLNKYPNVIFLWGHNHLMGDDQYGEILQPESNLTYANGRTARTIKFTYACAGAMTGNTEYRGLLANINGNDVKMQYIKEDGTPVSDITQVTTNGKGETNTDNVVEVNNNTTQINKTVGKNESFTIDVLNNGFFDYFTWEWIASPYTYTLTSTNEEVATVTSTAETPTAVNSTALFTVNAIEEGITSIQIYRDEVLFAKIKLTVGNPKLPADLLIPSVNNPSVKVKMKVGDSAKQFIIANESLYPITFNIADGIAGTDGSAVKVTQDGSDNAITELVIEGDSEKTIKIEAVKPGKAVISISYYDPFSWSTIQASISVVVSEKESDDPAGKIKYLAIGDSIGAGVKGGSGNSTEYSLYNTYGPDGSKNWDVNAVSYSYVNLFANKIGADSDNSWNGTAAGFRAKEICYILDDPTTDKDGIKPYKNGDFNYQLENVEWDDLVAAGFDVTKLNLDDYYGWAMGTQLQWSKMFRDVNKNAYREAVKNAEVITVELGANEFNAFAMYGPLMNRILPALMEAIEKTRSIGDNKDAAKLEQAYENITEIMRNPDEVGPEEISEMLEWLQKAKDIAGDMQEIGMSYGELVKAITESFDYAYKSFRYYWKTLMSYIRANNKGAVIVVTSVPNPVRGMSLGGFDLGQMGIGGLDLSSMEPGDLVEPFIKDMNNFIKSNARKYDYSIADISEVELNPKKDGVTDPDYKYHPNNEGHKQIFEAVSETYDKAVAGSDSVLSKIVATIRTALSRLFSLFGWGK